jgi:hypothetical protein
MLTIGGGRENEGVMMGRGYLSRVVVGTLGGIRT